MNIDELGPSRYVDVEFTVSPRLQIDLGGEVEVATLGTTVVSVREREGAKSGMPIDEIVFQRRGAPLRHGEVSEAGGRLQVWQLVDVHTFDVLLRTPPDAILHAKVGIAGRYVMGFVLDFPPEARHRVEETFESVEEPRPRGIVARLFGS